MPPASEQDAKALFNRSAMHIAPLSEGTPHGAGCEHEALHMVTMH